MVPLLVLEEHHAQLYPN